MHQHVCLEINEVINMNIQSCTFTIYFPPNNRVREQLFKLENHFIDFQKPFTLVSLPPDAPIELPRIVAISKNGHSQLTICGSNAQLTTSFDDAYNHDIEKCITYVHQKCKSIVEALSIINEGMLIDDAAKFYYSGLSMSISMDESDGIINPTKYITEKFFKCKMNLPEDEVQFRFALVVDETYYVNIMIQNNRIFAGGADERGSFANMKIEKEMLQVVLDINDRYAFNHQKDYISNNNAVNGIEELAKKFIDKYVVDFVKKGDLFYVER